MFSRSLEASSFFYSGNLTARWRKENGGPRLKMYSMSFKKMVIFQPAMLGIPEGYTLGWTTPPRIAVTTRIMNHF